MENKKGKSDVIPWMGSRINWPEGHVVLYWFYNVNILSDFYSIYTKEFGDISQKSAYFLSNISSANASVWVRGTTFQLAPNYKLQRPFKDPEICVKTKPLFEVGTYRELEDIYIPKTTVKL